VTRPDVVHIWGWGGYIYYREKRDKHDPNILINFQSMSSMRRTSGRVSQQSFDESALRRISLQDSKVVEDVRNANSEELTERSLSSSRKASNQVMKGQ
jgi:hypothetical protein